MDNAVALVACAGILFMFFYISYLSYEEEMDSGSELLSEINHRCERYLQHISSPQYRSEPLFKNILNRFGKNRIKGMKPGGDAAFTVDKGREIRLCLPDDYEMNTAVFVMLHELAHVGTDATGHPPVFWKNFSRVLEVAMEAGVYKYQNFSGASPGQYCGKKITYQPLRNGGRKPAEDWNGGKYALVEKLS